MDLPNPLRIQSRLALYRLLVKRGAHLARIGKCGEAGRACMICDSCLEHSAYGFGEREDPDRLKFAMTSHWLLVNTEALPARPPVPPPA